MSERENRNATRIALNTPVVIESIGQTPIKLHPNLAEVYSRVEPSAAAGDKFPGTLRDLSTNGAFVAGEALPLLSRIALLAQTVEAFFTGHGLDAALISHLHADHLDRGSLAVTPYKIEFFGKPAHASSSPESGINALDAMLQVFFSINQ